MEEKVSDVFYDDNKIYFKILKVSKVIDLNLIYKEFKKIDIELNDLVCCFCRVSDGKSIKRKKSKSIKRKKSKSKKRKKSKSKKMILNK
jgi:hypothetical protein